MVESLDSPAENWGRPRAFFARMISSKRRMEGCEGRFFSRSWINSLKACVSRIILAYSCWSNGKLLINPSMSKAYSCLLAFCSLVGRPRCFR